MSTGALAFRGDTSAAMFDSILHKAPVALVRLNPELPIKLEDIINKALEKDRNLRYQHAVDMRADLQRLKRDTDSSRSAVAVAAEPVVSAPAGASSIEPVAHISQSAGAAVSTPAHPKKKSWLVTLVAVLVAAIGTGIFLYMHRQQPLTQKDSILLVTRRFGDSTWTS
jgi:eukaryotic-like serine/threonine-protein kinase